MVCGDVQRRLAHGLDDGARRNRCAGHRVEAAPVFLDAPIALTFGRRVGVRKLPDPRAWFVFLSIPVKGKPHTRGLPVL